MTDATGGPTSDGLPLLGLGTWENTDPEACANAVATALETGYRHVDTAQIYGNEEHVGEGLARSTVPRDEVFLATKVWIDHLDREGVVESTERSLDRLGVEYVDLLYVHWPARTYEPAETLAAFDDLHDRGLIGGIGISNFEADQVDEAVETADAPVVANQIEVHPLLPQDDLVANCRDRGLDVVAYSPLARGAVFDTPEVRAVADRHGVSAAQVSLAWLRDRGIAAIPKATGEAHIRDNWRSLDVALDDEDRERIASVDRRERKVDPDWAPWNA